MKIKKMRELTLEELQQEHDKLISDHFQARVKHTLGQLEDPLQLRRMRRDIARARTLLAEGGVKTEVTYRRRQTSARASKATSNKKSTRAGAAASE